MGSGKWSLFFSHLAKNVPYLFQERCLVSGIPVEPDISQPEIYLQFLDAKLKPWHLKLGRNLGVSVDDSTLRRPRRNLKAMLVMEPPAQQCWPRQPDFLGWLRFCWCLLRLKSQVAIMVSLLLMTALLSLVGEAKEIGMMLLKWEAKPQKSQARFADGMMLVNTKIERWAMNDVGVWRLAFWRCQNWWLEY